MLNREQVYRTMDNGKPMLEFVRFFSFLLSPLSFFSFFFFFFFLFFWGGGIGWRGVRRCAFIAEFYCAVIIIYDCRRMGLHNVAFMAHT